MQGASDRKLGLMLWWETCKPLCPGGPTLVMGWEGGRQVMAAVCAERLQAPGWLKPLALHATAGHCWGPGPQVQG